MSLCGVFSPISFLIMRSVPQPGPGTPGGNPFASISLAPAILTSLLSLVELGLGIYLLVAGILLTQNRASSRKHHLRYAILKFPIAFFYAIATAWMQAEMQHRIFANMQMSGATTGTSATAVTFTPAALATWAAIGYAAFMLLLSLAYPTALLITLTRPKIRGYFAAMAP
jgi:hypothetical protein